MLNTTKVKSENTMFKVCCVRNEFTRLWSPIRCIRSPINLVSKNDIGSFKSLMKKSLTNEMLMRSEICNSSQRRIKSMAVQLTVSISCPKSISQIKPMFWFWCPHPRWIEWGKVEWVVTNCPRVAPRQSARNTCDTSWYNPRGTWTSVPLLD